MARTLFDIKLHELVGIHPQDIEPLEQKHRLRTMADVDSLTEGGQYLDRIDGIKGLRANTRKTLKEEHANAVAALDKKEAERHRFSWLRGKPRDAEHGDGGEG